MDADLYEHLSTTVTAQPQEPDSTATQAVDKSQDTAIQDGETSPGASDNIRRQRTSVSLPQEIDQVVNAISSSPWAARLGNLVGSVKKQVVSLCFNHGDNDSDRGSRVKQPLRVPRSGPLRSSITFGQVLPPLPRLSPPLLLRNRRPWTTLTNLMTIIVQNYSPVQCFLT